MERPDKNLAVPYLSNIAKALQQAKTKADLYELVVNAPFRDKLKTTMMGLGIVVLLVVNEKTKTIDRVALSKTEQADGAVEASVIPFKEIKVPLNHKTNYISKAIKSGKPQLTTDWQHLFSPALSPQEARLNQAGAAIACSHIYPFGGPTCGALIFSYYVSPSEITPDELQFMSEYSQLVASAVKA